MTSRCPTAAPGCGGRPRSRSASAGRCPAGPRPGRNAVGRRHRLLRRRRRCGCRWPMHLAASSPGCPRRPGCRPRPGCGAPTSAAGAARAVSAGRLRPEAVGTRAAGRRTRCPCPAPSLRASTVPPCISTSRLHQRQPDPQPALRPLQRPVHLREHLEDLRQHGRAGCRCRCPSPTPRPRCPAARRSARCGRPARVYLAALFSRLENTWASRVGSASR